MSRKISHWKLWNLHQLSAEERLTSTKWSSGVVEVQTFPTGFVEIYGFPLAKKRAQKRTGTRQVHPTLLRGMSEDPTENWPPGFFKTFAARWV